MTCTEMLAASKAENMQLEAMLKNALAENRVFQTQIQNLEIVNANLEDIARAEREKTSEFSYAVSILKGVLERSDV